MSVNTGIRRRVKKCELLNINECYVEATNETLDILEDIYNDRQKNRIGNSNIIWARNIIKEYYNSGILKIKLINYDDLPCAFILYFVMKQKVYIWMISFKEYGSKIEIGNYGNYITIKRAFLDNVKLIDFMRGSYLFKKQFACDVYENYVIHIFTNRFTKLLYIIQKITRTIAHNIVYNNSLLKSLYKKISKKVTI
jgi:hypothetical protein